MENIKDKKDITSEIVKKTNEDTNNLSKYNPDLVDNHPLIKDYMELADVIVKSGLTPHKKTEDATVAMLTGKELGFKPMVSLNNIHSINGKAGLGIHLLTAMLLKAGIRYKIVKDFERAETPNSSASGANDFLLRVTEVVFTRFYKNPDGTFERVDTTMKYTMAEASMAGLLDKDNWKKMPKIMLRTRCITLGARLVAPDVILGMYEYSELAEIEGKDKEIINSPEFVAAEVVDENEN